MTGEDLIMLERVLQTVRAFNYNVSKIYMPLGGAGSQQFLELDLTAAAPEDLSDGEKSPKQQAADSLGARARKTLRI
jgi:hypothetical protein